MRLFLPHHIIPLMQSANTELMTLCIIYFLHRGTGKGASQKSKGTLATASEIFPSFLLSQGQGRMDGVLGLPKALLRSTALRLPREGYEDRKGVSVYLTPAFRVLGSTVNLAKGNLFSSPLWISE